QGHRDRAAGRRHDLVPEVAHAADLGCDAWVELAVLGENGAVDVEADEPALTRAGHVTGSSTSSPRKGRSGSGTRTEPSARWCVSSSATIQRVVASVPLRVATGLVFPSSPRRRMSRRRAWNVVQLLVEVSSR